MDPPPQRDAARDAVPASGEPECSR